MSRPGNKVSAPKVWRTSRFSIDLTRPKVMGIVNVTPDSFSDGGRFVSPTSALQHCEQLLKDGADILDIGGESSRPGSDPLALEEELARVLPVLASAVTLGVPVSVDTYKPAVMRAALDLGADIINDIWALRWREPSVGTTAPEGTVLVAAHPGCGVCLMHMHREPRTMQLAPMQGDVVQGVLDFLSTQGHMLESLGVQRERIVIDPGIGFGKTVEQNFALLKGQAQLGELGYPVLAGWSRKSSLVAVAGEWVGEGGQPEMRSRLVPSVTAALLSVQRGARIVRVHDVRETVQAMQVLAAASLIEDSAVN